MRPFLLAVAIVASFAAFAAPAQQPTPPNMPVLPPPPMAPIDAAPAVSPLENILAGDWRSDANRARDKYRHPRETLGFFGIAPSQHVIEIWPGGGGWYAEILAPLLRDKGRYIGAVPDPAKAADEEARAYAERNNQKLRDLFKARADVFGKAELVEVNSASPVLGPPASADAVLTFRNVHNWVMDGNEQVMFKALFAVLKPGGTLGVVDHRARADQPPVEMQSSGYLPEAYVIALATGAGFELVGKSEVNANPLDTKDYADGVWTLPPRLAKGDVDRAKYLAIGESDRMTLRFTKPAK
jgi:predicted methyltransferase